MQTMVVALVGVVLGALACRYYKPALRWLRPVGVFLGVVEPKQRIGHDSDALQKNPTQASIPDMNSERVAVLLIAGQSNAANYGQGEGTADDPNILNFFRGKCFVARDPLLGATGPWQAPWKRAAQRLIASGRFDTVVIITTAAGGTGVEEWSGDVWPGRGGLNQRLIDRITEAKAAGLVPTHFLWHQGERDANKKTSPTVYANALRKVIGDVRKTAGVDVPAFIALATRGQIRMPDETIRKAQGNVAATASNTFIAIDSDALGFAFRYDGVHLFSNGLEHMAAGYADAILNETQRTRLRLAKD